MEQYQINDVSTISSQEVQEGMKLLKRAKAAGHEYYIWNAEEFKSQSN